MLGTILPYFCWTTLLKAEFWFLFLNLYLKEIYKFHQIKLLACAWCGTTQCYFILQKCMQIRHTRHTRPWVLFLELQQHLLLGYVNIACLELMVFINMCPRSMRDSLSNILGRFEDYTIIYGRLSTGLGTFLRKRHQRKRWLVCRQFLIMCCYKFADELGHDKLVCKMLQLKQIT